MTLSPKMDDSGLMCEFCKQKNGAEQHWPYKRCWQYAALRQDSSGGEPVAWQIIGKTSGEIISLTSDTHEIKLAVEGGHLIRGLYVSPIAAPQESRSEVLEEAVRLLRRVVGPSFLDNSLPGQIEKFLASSAEPGAPEQAEMVGAFAAEHMLSHDQEAALRSFVSKIAAKQAGQGSATTPSQEGHAAGPASAAPEVKEAYSKDYAAGLARGLAEGLEKEARECDASRTHPAC